MPETFPDLFLQGQQFLQRGGDIRDLVNVFRRPDGTEFCNGVFFSEYTNVLGEGQPSPFNNQLRFYRQSLCDFACALPMQSQWLCFISPENSQYLFGEIGKLNQYEPVGDKATNWKYGNSPNFLIGKQQVIGNIFANGVSIPGDSFSVNNAGANSNQNYGFIRGPIAENRAAFAPLEIVFKETNASFAELCRAWEIVAAHKGLIASGNSIKATITVMFLSYTKSLQAPMVSKAYSFYGCVPNNINSEQYDYGGAKMVERNISWVYNNYAVFNDLRGYRPTTDQGRQISPETRRAQIPGTNLDYPETRRAQIPGTNLDYPYSSKDVPLSPL